MPKQMRDALDALSDEELILKLCGNVTHMISGTFLPALRDHLHGREPPSLRGVNLSQKRATRAKEYYPLLAVFLLDVLATMNRLIDLDDENVAMPSLLEDYRGSCRKRWPDSAFAKFLD